MTGAQDFLEADFVVVGAGSVGCALDGAGARYHAIGAWPGIGAAGRHVDAAPGFGSPVNHRERPAAAASRDAAKTPQKLRQMPVEAIAFRGLRQHHARPCALSAGSGRRVTCER
jgi:hypothetical protein